MDKDKLPEQGKTGKPQTDKVQTQAEEHAELERAAYEKAGFGRPKGGFRFKIFRAKTGKWEYMDIDSNPPVPPLDGGDDEDSPPDKG